MILAVILVLIVIGSVLFHIFSPWQATPAASNWGSVDETLFLTVAITGLFFVVITLFVAIAIVRFRHREGHRAHYEPENRKLEWWLIGITSTGIVAMLAPGLVVYNNFVQVPEDAYELEVVGQQWQWTFRFAGNDGQLGRSDIQWVNFENPLGLDPRDPNGQDDKIIQSNEVHIPLGQPVKVLLRSKDVLHNFYVPQIRGKMDMVPGMVSWFWFTPTRTGSFEILCAEFCGVGHFNMRGKLHVASPEAFTQWLSAQPTFAETQATSQEAQPDPLVRKGRLLAENNGCIACHSLDGSKSLGPTWLGLYGKTEQLNDGSSVTVDDAYLKESILDPNAKLVEGYPPVMVAYPFSDDDLIALIAFIRSLTQAVPTQPSAQTDSPPKGNAESLVREGRQLAHKLGCLGCHSEDGSKGLGPTWLGMFGRTETLNDGSTVKVDEAYFRQSIANPNAAIVQGFAPVMPAYQLDEQQLAALIAFARSKANRTEIPADSPTPSEPTSD